MAQSPDDDDVEEIQLPDGTFLTDENAAEAGERVIEAARKRAASRVA
jgi:hypothetical protein